MFQNFLFISTVIFVAGTSYYSSQTSHKNTSSEKYADSFSGKEEEGFVVEFILIVLVCISAVAYVSTILSKHKPKTAFEHYLAINDPVIYYSMSRLMKK